MKAKFKKYNVGGIIQAGLGAAQTVYGISQLPRARAEFERARAAAPSLETPSQYYENYKNAYDSELARMQDDMIQRNLATSVQALQGAGGRALIGGLNAATAQSQAAQMQMLAGERAARMQAGQQLAAAQEREVGRKEVRSQQNIQMANQGYQAALGNIGAGIGAMGTGLMYGLEDFSLKDMIEGRAARKEYMATPITNAFKPKDGVAKLGLDESIEKATKSANAELKRIADNFVQTRTNEAAMGLEKAQTDFLLENEKRRRALEASKKSQAAKSNQDTQETGFQISPENQSIIDRYESKQNLESSFAPFSYRAAQKIKFTPEEQIVINNYIQQQQQQPKESIFGKSIFERAGYNTREYGGMMTAGEFNHSTNPIDIVQNGVKVGEATGEEYIINPEQAAKIAQQSSFARKLFKRFEKNAKKNK